MNDRDDTGERSGRTVPRPELTTEQLGKVDETLLHWADAGLLAYVKNHAGETIVRVEDLARMLRTLAHCAALTGLQGLVTRRCEENRGPDMAFGFIAAAKAVEYLADRCSTKAVTLCSSDPHKYLNDEWNEIAKSRDYVLDDIERVAPGWCAKAQELVAAYKKAPLAKPLTDKRPEGVYDARGGYAGDVQQPSPGFAERIAAAKAGIGVTETGELRIKKVTDRLHVYLGRPGDQLLAVKGNETASESLNRALADFIGGYEAKTGERLSDNEVRYLHELVGGTLTPASRVGYVRLVGAEKRDTRFKPEDFR